MTSAKKKRIESSVEPVKKEKRHLDMHSVDPMKQVAPAFADCKTLFLQQIADCLTPRFFAPGDIVAREGDEVEEIYFLRRGFAEGKADGGRPELFNAGSVIGCVGMLMSRGTRWPQTVTTQDVCDCQVMTIKSFKEATQMHGAEMRKISRKLESLKVSWRGVTQRGLLNPPASPRATCTSPSLPTRFRDQVSHKSAGNANVNVLVETPRNHLWDDADVARQEAIEAAHRSLAAWLQGTPFFERMDSSFLTRLLPLLERRTFKRGDRVIEEGSVMDSFHVIRAGVVRILVRGEPVGLLGSSTVLGDVPIPCKDDVGPLGASHHPIATSSAIVATEMLTTVSARRTSLAIALRGEPWLARQAETQIQTQRIRLKCSASQAAPMDFAAALGAIAPLREHYAGEVLDQYEDAAYVLRKGTIELSTASGDTLVTVNNHTGPILIGEYNLLGIAELSESIASIEDDCELHELRRCDLLGLLDQYPKESWRFRRLIDSQYAEDEKAVEEDAKRILKKGLSWADESTSLGKGLCEDEDGCHSSDSEGEANGDMMSQLTTDVPPASPSLDLAQVLVTALLEVQVQRDLVDLPPRDTRSESEIKSALKRKGTTDDPMKSTDTTRQVTGFRRRTQAYRKKKEHSDTSVDLAFGRRRGTEFPVDSGSESLEPRRKPSTPPRSRREKHSRSVMLVGIGSRDFGKLQTDSPMLTVLNKSRQLRVDRRLSSISELAELSKSALRIIEKRQELRMYVQGQTILREGDDLTHVYVIHSARAGESQARAGESPIIGGINAFTGGVNGINGESSIIGSINAFTAQRVERKVAAVETCFVGAIPKRHIARVLDDFPEDRKRLLHMTGHVIRLELLEALRCGREFVRRLAAFKPWHNASPEFLSQVATTLTPRFYFPGQTVKKSQIHVILEGTCVVASDGMVQATIRQGDVVGLLTTFGFEVPEASNHCTVHAVGPCVVGTIPREVFRQSLAAHPAERKLLERLVHDRLGLTLQPRLEAQLHFEGWPDPVFEKLCESIDRRVYIGPCQVARERTQGSTMFIVNSGMLEITWSGITVGLLWPGKSFGMAQLVGITPMYHASLYAKAPCHVLEFTQDILKAIEGFWDQQSFTKRNSSRGSDVKTQHFCGGKSTVQSRARWLKATVRRASATLEAELHSFRQRFIEYRHLYRSGNLSMWNMAFQSITIDFLVSPRPQDILRSLFVAWQIIASEQRAPVELPRNQDSVHAEYLQAGPPIQYSRGLLKVELEGSGQSEGGAPENCWGPSSQPGRLDMALRSVPVPSWLAAVRDEIPKQLTVLRTA
jgi:CRP-like cAMP-binding protein